MKLSAEERDTFRERGLLHLRRLVRGDITRKARAAVIDELARLGARANGKWHMSKFPKKLRHHVAFDEVIPNGLGLQLSELAGLELVRAEPHPQLLLTPPGGGAWTVPALGWHLDVAPPRRDEVPGIQVFVLIDDVAAGGGGTVAVAGSHRLHGLDGRSPVSAHRALQADPLYAQLFQPSSGDRGRFLEPHLLDGVTVQVVEMCGEAGDAYLMDMRTVHAAASNVTGRPRMALTSRYLSREPQR